MDRRIADIEYQQMLLGRFSASQHRPDDGVERSAYLLLSRLHQQGPMSIGELSVALRLDTSTVHRQTSSAMNAGLLERIHDPSGGIARKFNVTAEGEKRLLATRQRSLTALEHILDEWPDDDVNRFADYLSRFNLAIEGYGERTARTGQNN
ncbi:DNA-binding MarR family transcriptional regulator [Pseudoclavibacter sp. JAI123]|uniref:MarR family winged helix-turn-helix transcriptional regulator n=1 Tax=Pseudoclavibacter sp. JAI123 TaxID=2723065 RepID=UPI0015C93F75|nr:MarR family winged helix-turn-helix transcriptional regulator [Pseudoclavibacter sp. JAI123]NYF12244.1 DNA-binding MarR family transcriptional regulator [Pseudoclavibacter sp. JAI123]